MKYFCALAILTVILSSCYSIHTKRTLIARSLIDNSKITSYSLGVVDVNLTPKSHYAVMDSIFMDQVKQEASQRGWQQAQKSDPKNAVIILRLVEPPPSIENYSYSVPSYNMIGGGSSTFNATTNIPSVGSYTTTGSIYTSPTLQQTGSTSYSAQYAQYRFIAYINCLSSSNQSLFEVASSISKYLPITDKDRREVIAKAVKSMATNYDN